MTPTECRKAIQEKREQRAKIQAKLADATGKEKLSLRLEDARLAEDINTLARVLRDLLPQHHIGKPKSSGWSKLETLTWNEISLKTWKELEAETNSEEVFLMERAARETMDNVSSILSKKQNVYFSAVGQTMEPYQRGKQTQGKVSIEMGVDSSTVCRAIGRARKRLRSDAQKRYLYLKNACKDGVRLDVSDKDTIKVLLSTLTERQLLYIVLYYGNWMSTREIGDCLCVDHSTVSRTICRGLEKLSFLVSNREVELSGVPELEMRIMEYINDIPPEKPKTKAEHQQRQARNRWVMAASERTLRLRRGLFFFVTEKGKLGEMLRTEPGLHTLVLKAIAALKNAISGKRGERR